MAEKYVFESEILKRKVSSETKNLDKEVQEQEATNEQTMGGQTQNLDEGVQEEKASNEQTMIGQTQTPKSQDAEELKNFTANEGVKEKKSMLMDLIT